MGLCGKFRSRVVASQSEIPLAARTMSLWPGDSRYELPGSLPKGSSWPTADRSPDIPRSSACPFVFMGLVRRQLRFLSAPILRYDRLSVSIKSNRRLFFLLPFFLPPLSLRIHSGTIRQARRKRTQDTKRPEK